MHTKLETIAVRDLRASLTNPRKTFAPGPLQELADSIRAQGMRQPILARPKAGDTPFEIVAGERRYRAAKLAGLELVPCLVSDMSDREALEVQVVENLQRSDLTELEEAASYQAMLDLKDEQTGAPFYTVPQLAERFGVERTQIYRRLKLLDLAAVDGGREALESGQLGGRQAVLIARIPDPAARQAALSEVLQPQTSKEPLTFLETKELIERKYMQGLKGAPFKLDDATLVPDAGPCATCPKMSDNCAHLFSGDEAKDFAKKKVCTDPGCFRRKVDAVWKQRTEDAEREGLIVLDARASAAIFRDSLVKGEMAFDSPYVHIGDKPEASLLKPEVVDSVGSWGQLLEQAEKATAANALEAARDAIRQDPDLSKADKTAALKRLDENPPGTARVPRVLARDQNGAARVLVERKLAITAIELAGEPIFLGKVGWRPKDGVDDFAEARKKELAAAQLRTAESLEGMARMHAALVKVWQPSPIWESLFEIAMGHAGADGLWLVGKWQGLKFGEHQTGKEDAVAKWAGELPAVERQALVPLLLIGQEMKWSGLSEGFRHIAESAGLGLDLDDIERTAKARLKAKKERKKPKGDVPAAEMAQAEAEARAAVKAAKPKKLSKKEKLAAEAAGYGWNEHGVATTPRRHVTMAKLPEGVKCEITVALAPDGKWRYGYDLQSRLTGQEGRSAAPNLKGEKFKTADDAVVAGFTMQGLTFFHNDPAVLRIVALDADPEVAQVHLTEAGAVPEQAAPQIAAKDIPTAAVIAELLGYDDACKSLEEMAYLTHLPKETVRAVLRAAGREKLGCEFEGSGDAATDAREKLKAAIKEALPGATESAIAKILAKYIKRVCGADKPASELTAEESFKIVGILAQAKGARKGAAAAVTTASEQEAA